MTDRDPVQVELLAAQRRAANLALTLDELATLSRPSDKAPTESPLDATFELYGPPRREIAMRVALAQTELHDIQTRINTILSNPQDQ